MQKKAIGFQGGWVITAVPFNHGSHFFTSGSKRIEEISTKYPDGFVDTSVVINRVGCKQILQCWNSRSIRYVFSVTVVQGCLRTWFIVPILFTHLYELILYSSHLTEPSCSREEDAEAPHKTERVKAEHSQSHAHKRIKGDRRFANYRRGPKIIQLEPSAFRSRRSTAR